MEIMEPFPHSSQPLRQHYSKPTFEIAEVAIEIACLSLGASDLLLLQTEHSAYSFSLTDAHQLRGLLMGGVFGDEGTAAVLLGALGKENGGCEPAGVKLKIGERAVFLIERDDTRMITSVIQGLFHLKPIESSRIII